MTTANIRVKRKATEYDAPIVGSGSEVKSEGQQATSWCHASYCFKRMNVNMASAR